MFFEPNYKSPLIESVTVSVPEGSSNTATFQVDSTERWYIKQVNITVGANTVVRDEGVILDGEPSQQTASTDFTSVFGDLMVSAKKITVTADNAGTGNGAEDLTVEIIGYRINK